ncbi:MAG: hypothetical protein CME64_12255 [Halobacteriovoraceae bacterium]|nr:hypothetical protein [Halobacteriovoraceae bacterium]|tara:strand:+ start:247190 stop:247825 length:636 start_codon:yes stop_codon:yes gene_type:complete
MNTEQFETDPGHRSSGENYAKQAKDIGVDKLQEYGKEGLAPLMEVFNKYGEEFNQYINHINSGLKSAAKELQNDSSGSEEKKVVASWFKEGAQWTEKLEQRLKDSSPEELLDFVESQGKQHPAALFATSLLAGSVFGRIGKYAVKENTESTSGQNVGAARTKSESEFDPQMDPRVDTAESAGTSSPRDVSGSVSSNQGQGYTNQNRQNKNI